MITKNSSGLLEKKFTSNEEKASFDPTIISAIEGVYVFSPVIGDIDDTNDRITVPAEFYANLENGSKVRFIDGAGTLNRFIRKISTNVISLYPTLSDAIADTNKSAISASAGKKIALQTFKLDNSVNRNLIVDIDSFESYMNDYDAQFKFVYPSIIADKSIFSISLSNKGSISDIPVITIVDISDLNQNIFYRSASGTTESLSFKTVYVNSTIGHLALEA